MGLVGEERREFQRLLVDPPIQGTHGGRDVTIVEIGVLGARIRHSEALELDYADLKFPFADAEVTLRCEVVRSNGVPPDIESAVRFLAAVGESGAHLRDFLAQRVAHEFEVRRSMPQNTIPTEAAVDGDKTVSWDHSKLGGGY